MFSSEPRRLQGSDRTPLRSRLTCEMSGMSSLDRKTSAARGGVFPHLSPRHSRLIFFFICNSHCRAAPAESYDRFGGKIPRQARRWISRRIAARLSTGCGLRVARPDSPCNQPTKRRPLIASGLFRLRRSSRRRRRARSRSRRSSSRDRRETRSDLQQAFQGDQHRRENRRG